MNNNRTEIWSKWLMRTFLIFSFSHFLNVQGQDSKSQYHPINHAVISQTIAPDGRHRCSYRSRCQLTVLESC